MDYKQKYEEALERAKMYQGMTVLPAENMIETIFPELRESEDERIRKEILEYFQQFENEELRGINISDWIAWLKKQGGQKLQGKTALETINEEKIDNVNYAKSADKVKPKFHKGDWVVVSTTKGDRVVQIASVEYFKDGHPSYFTTEGRWFGNGTKARLLTNKDVEITTIPENRAIVNKIKSWSEEDEKTWKELIEEVKDQLDSVPSPDCRDKEDEKVLKQLTRWLDWLKSLKQKIGWEPTKEQMDALLFVVQHYTPNVTDKLAWDSIKILELMYHDLKKLTE